MQRNLKRLAVGLLLGMALAFGALGVGQPVQPALAGDCDPGGCTGSGGGG